MAEGFDSGTKNAVKKIPLLTVCSSKGGQLSLNARPALCLSPSVQMEEVA